MPWRLAVADTRRGPAKLSSTILTFSSSDQRRRRPVATISSRPNALIVCLMGWTPPRRHRCAKMVGV
jgi:hypothetical protein